MGDNTNPFEPPYPEVFAALVQPGEAVRLFYSEGNQNNEIRHIRAIVDDEEVVYRVWSKAKQRWVYRIDWIGALLMLWRDGNLSRA